MTSLQLQLARLLRIGCSSRAVRFDKKRWLTSSVTEIRPVLFWLPDTYYSLLLSPRYWSLQKNALKAIRSKMTNKNTNMISIEDNTDCDRPTTPTEEDCCGNGCNPCIFDVHKKLLEVWEKRKLCRTQVPPDKNYLSPIKYSKFIVGNSIKASEDCIFLHIYCESECKNDALFLIPGQHIMIKTGTVTRPYTPIAWDQKSIKLLIKLYLNGVSSNYFKQLQINDELFVRGPYGEFQYQRNSYKDIIMLSIGSGIAAIYPIAQSIVKDELEDTKIKMIIGFKSLLHVPLKNELRLLTDYWNFDCVLYLSQDCNSTMSGVKIVNNRLDKEIISEILSSYLTNSSLILICGTPVFNETVEKIVTAKNFTNYHVFR